MYHTRRPKKTFMRTLEQGYKADEEDIHENAGTREAKP